MVEEKHIIRGFEEYYEKYGTVITDTGPIHIKISDIRGLAWLAAITLRRECEFGEDDLIGTILFTKEQSPTGILLKGIIWRAKQNKGV